MVSIKRFWLLLFTAILTFCANESTLAAASVNPLQARLEQFPDWKSPPILQPAKGDLYYPDWMAGTWQVTSTLTDVAAPLAPAVAAPGFDASRKMLQQPVRFSVRFGPDRSKVATLPVRSPFPVGAIAPEKSNIVADRVYNGMSLAEATLGKRVLRSIRVDPQSPNRQVAVFENGQSLTAEIGDRGVETPFDRAFASSELYLQTFRSASQIYFNRVENTISYQLISVEPPHIEANQVTAIYLSPQDPDYFKAKDHPVALYRYRLEFDRPS
ncbi:DUF6816 family protein [Altericista sp. CCNU0014]|uniref:DUF6816 family protein n=1 Tax=Altericista sp. CCNU0014 TaxID=3082949 RepID=UPI00384EBDB8